METKTEEEKQKAFVTEYDELCQKHGYKIAPQPKFVPTNHGSFEIAIEMILIKQ